MSQGGWDPVPFRASLTARLKAAAAARSRPYAELGREYLLQRFLARVFADPQGPWVLKGGTGLLARLPGARHSQDLDLLHTATGLDAAVADLQALAEVEAGDPFTFVVGSPRPMTGGVAGARVVVRALLGATEFGSFPVDLSTELAMVAAVERRHVQPVVEVDRIGPLPAFVLYPLADQVADKVCALYERYGPQRLPSTRYRDLVDLVLITMHFDLDAAELTAALAQESARRQLQLPSGMEAPGAAWGTAVPADRAGHDGPGWIASTSRGAGHGRGLPGPRIGACPHERAVARSHGKLGRYSATTDGPLVTAPAPAAVQFSAAASDALPLLPVGQGRRG